MVFRKKCFGGETYNNNKIEEEGTTEKSTSRSDHKRMKIREVALFHRTVW
jgi:hypothetical protein